MKLMKNGSQLIKNLIVILSIVTFSVSFDIKTSFAQNTEAETELFVIAQKAFEDGFYDVAIRYINQLLEEHPNTEKKIEAKLLLGQCYFFKSQYLQAYDNFQSLLNYTEFKDATLYWLGETLLKGSDYTQAIKQYEQLVELYPQSIYSAQAYYSLGWTYFEQNEFKKAIKSFTDLISHFPNHQLAEDAIFKIAESHYNLKDYDDTISGFNDYLSHYPQSTRKAEAHFYIAESYYYQKKFSDAISDYLQAAELAYDNKIILMSKVSIGWCYLKLGNYEKSMQFFNESQELSQSIQVLSDDVYLGEASLYSELNENEKALHFYTELIEKFPESERITEAYLGQANTYYILKNYPNAIETYKTLIKKLHEEAKTTDIFEKAYFGLAWSYLKMGQIDLSIRTFQEIKDITKNNIVKVSALTQIGDAYQDINRLQDAINVYDNILENYPNSIYIDYVQYRQGIALLKMDKIESATISFLSLQSNFPDSKYVHDVKYYLSVAYFKNGDWVSAKKEVEEFMKKLPLDNEFLPEAHHILALSEFNLKDYKAAFKTFKKIVKNFPNEETMVKNAKLSMAKCLYKMGDISASIQNLKKLIIEYPNSNVSQDALLWIAEHYLETEGYENAVTYFTQFIESFPGSPKVDVAYYELGETYQALKKFDKAISFYNKISSENKELVGKSKLAIASIFSNKLEPQSAIETYQNIIDTSPSFRRMAYLKLAEVFIAQKDYQQSLGAYEKALSAEQGSSHISDSQLQFLIADNYELLNNPQKAVESYLRIPYLYDEDTDWIIKAYLRIGRIFEDEEKWEEAKTIYKKITQYKTEVSKFANERIAWINTNIKTINH